MLNSGMNLITTVIGFGLSATFIVFVCTRVICWRIRGDESSRQMFEIETGMIDLEPAEHRVMGLEPVLITAIPTMKFSHESFTSLEDAQCSICLGDYQEKEILRIMPKCGHNFHLACIDIWLQKHCTCPVCRFPIRDSLQPMHLGQATFTFRMVQSLDYPPETSTEHSQQWLLPGPRRSERLDRNQRHVDSIPGNSQLTSLQ